MTVRRRIEGSGNENIDVDALISRGAKVKEDHATDKKKWTYINVRISVDMLNSVDDAVDNRVGITRTGWILEAIHEKTKRENNGT
jgi:hypothetical protein